MRTGRGRYGEHRTGRWCPILWLSHNPRMTVTRRFQYGRTSFILFLLLSGLCGRSRAEDPTEESRTDLFPRDFSTILASSAPANSPLPRSNRISLFRITPGFMPEAAGLDFDESISGAATPPQELDDGPSWLQVSFSGDNPFLDLRRRGDPGGVGFYRIDSQVQLLDSSTTGFTIGLRAVTPAGREANGAADGQTVFLPSFSLFHAIDDNLAIQAFIGKKMRLDVTQFGGPLHHAVEYGMALQRPLVDGPAGQGKVYLFVEALGTYRFVDGAESPAMWQMVPGVHYRIDQNWWLTGGWIVPLVTRPDTGQWQISCWMQF